MKRYGTVILLLSPLLGGCSGNAASAGDSRSTDAGEAGAVGTAPTIPLSPGSCASLSWGQQVAPSSDGECAGIALGRWQLCDAGGALLLPDGSDTGAGIEFAQENGVLDFYVLMRGDGGELVRSLALDERGFVDQPSTWTIGACHYWAAPASVAGSEFGWAIERFHSPDAMLISGALAYVPAP